MSSLVSDFLSTFKRALTTPIAIGMLIIQFLSGVFMFLIVPFFDIILEDLNTTMTFIGLEEGLYSLAYGFGSIIWGYLAGKVSERKHLLIIATIGSLLGTWLTSMAWNMLTFMFGRIIMGFFISVAYPVNTSISADIFPAGERVRFYSLLIYAEMFGMTVSPAVGIVLLPYMGWREIVLMFILVELIALAFISPVREPPRGAAEEELKKLIEMGITYTGVLTIEGLKKIARRKSNVLIVTQAVFGVWAWGVYGRWLLYYFMTEFNVSKLIAGAFIIVMGFAMVLGFPLQSYMDRVRKRKGLRVQVLMNGILTGTFATLFIIMFLIPHKPYSPSEYSIIMEEKISIALEQLSDLIMVILSNTSLVITLSIGFWAYFVATPTGSTTFSVLSEVNLPEERGIVVAFEKLMEYVGQFLGLTISGILLDILFRKSGSYNYGLILLLSTFMWYIAVAFWYVTSKYVEKDYSIVKEEIRERLQNLQSDSLEK